MMSATHKRIKYLYAQSVLDTLQAIMLFIAALFSTALLPSLVVRYFFAEQDLFAPPAVVEYIPVVSFAISALYFLYVVVANVRRGMMISKMQKQAEIETASCGCGDCNCDDHGSEAIDMVELKELEAMVDAALETKAAPKKKTTRRKRATKK